MKEKINTISTRSKLKIDSLHTFSLLMACCQIPFLVWYSPTSPDSEKLEINEFMKTEQVDI